MAFFAIFTARAQIVDTRAKTDTLKLVDRFSLRTNMVDWVLLTPNIGVEFDLGNTNWSRWAIGLNIRTNWNTSHTYKPGVVYNVSEVRGEVRNYWRHHQDNDRKKNDGFMSRLRSRMRNMVHPASVFYRGVYASYTDFSIKLGSEGRQGKALTLGVTAGFVRPLYVFRHGTSLDLEFGVSVGASYAKYDKYRHDREDNCYPVTERGSGHIVPYPVVSDIRLGFVYRLGKYPSTSKYRWRQDVDHVYADSLRARELRMETARINKHNADSIRKLIDADFNRIYAVRLRENKANATAARTLQQQQEHQAKAEEKARRREEKAAERRKKGEGVLIMGTDSVAATDSLTFDSITAGGAPTDTIAVSAEPVTATEDVSTAGDNGGEDSIPENDKPADTTAVSPEPAPAAEEESPAGNTNGGDSTAESGAPADATAVSPEPATATEEESPESDNNGEPASAEEPSNARKEVNE